MYPIDSLRIPWRAGSLSHSSPSSDSLPQRAAFDDAHLANDSLTSVKSAAPQTKMPLVLLGFVSSSSATDFGLTFCMKQPSSGSVKKSSSVLRRVNLSVRQLGALGGLLGVNTGSFPPPLFSGETMRRL